MFHFYDWDTRQATLLRAIRAHSPRASTLLDCGCGTGRYLELFARDFETTGFDIDKTMVQISSERSPRSTVLQADMTDFEVGRQFDVVACLFRSIGYVQTLERMQTSVACMSRHVVSSGLLLLEPYFTPEEYWVDQVTLNTARDEDGALAWMYVSRREERLSILETHYLAGSASDGVVHFTEMHVLGLFTKEEYESALHDAGLEILARPTVPGNGAYVCRKAEAPTLSRGHVTRTVAS